MASACKEQSYSACKEQRDAARWYSCKGRGCLARNKMRQKPHDGLRELGADSSLSRILRCHAMSCPSGNGGLAAAGRGLARLHFHASSPCLVLVPVPVPALLFSFFLSSCASRPPPSHRPTSLARCRPGGRSPLSCHVGTPSPRHIFGATVCTAQHSKDWQLKTRPSWCQNGSRVLAGFQHAEAGAKPTNVFKV